jgi:hypothetical protein
MSSVRTTPDEGRREAGRTPLRSDRCTAPPDPLRDASIGNHGKQPLHSPMEKLPSACLRWTSLRPSPSANMHETASIWKLLSLGRGG